MSTLETGQFTSSVASPERPPVADRGPGPPARDEWSRPRDLSLGPDGPRELPPTRCHFCGYDLQGLPADHACPECGRQLGLRVWPTTGGRVVWQRALAVMIVVMVPSLVLGAVDVIWWGSSPWVITACLGIAAILLATVVVILKRLSRPPARNDAELLLSTDGLTVRPRRGESIHVPWTSFGSVRISRDLGGLRLLELHWRRRGRRPLPALSYAVDVAEIDPGALRELIERLMTSAVD
ncbi:MAG: hypothetical protein ACYSU2_06945 [Planctomycetota bacterium]